MKSLTGILKDWQVGETLKMQKENFNAGRGNLPQLLSSAHSWLLNTVFYTTFHTINDEMLRVLSGFLIQ